VFSVVLLLASLLEDMQVCRLLLFWFRRGYDQCLSASAEQFILRKIIYMNDTAVVDFVANEHLYPAAFSRPSIL